MATASVAAKGRIKDIVFEWEGKDKNGKPVRGEMRAGGEAMVSASLRRQGVMVNKVKKRRMSGGKPIKQKDIAVFTRQLTTMMRAGVPLIQAFDIVARGSTNARMTRLLTDIRSDVETGTSLSAAFRKHPMYFDALYCNLVEAGEAGGILEQLLDRLAIYQEKTMAIKNKIKSALIYPIAVMVVAFIVLAVIMIFVIPAFEDVFSSFGADLPAPTLVVITLSTMFAAGVPLVEALDSVGGAAGNAVFQEATEQIQRDVSTGSALTTSMQTTGVFPTMVVQMCAIGEESGSLDAMLGKAAEFYEDEIDEAVKGLSSLMEPFIIVILGVLVGGIVVSMYLPIFKLGQVV